MAEPKRTAAGRDRRGWPRWHRWSPIWRRWPPRRLAGSAPDDVLDACALAWSARRLALGGGNRVGHEIDGTGLPMTVAW